MVCRASSLAPSLPLCGVSSLSSSTHPLISICKYLSFQHCQSVSLVSDKFTNQPTSTLMMLIYFFQDTLQRNYQKSKMKRDWLSGRYSNLSSLLSLPEKMYSMDADTWGEILEEELKRDAKKITNRSHNLEKLKLK